jgi:hypothetical protein
MAKISHDLIMAVREMLERHWSIADMAAKLNVDYDDVRIIVELINQVLT